VPPLRSAATLTRKGFFEPQTRLRALRSLSSPRKITRHRPAAAKLRSWRVIIVRSKGETSRHGRSMESGRFRRARGGCRGRPHHASPGGASWVWTLVFGHHEDRTPTHGYAESREAAMAAFAKSWRRE
jgi:hypothetical protein